MTPRPSRPSKPPTPSALAVTSLLYRIGKFILSIYVLCALFYTFYHFVIEPTASIVSGSGSTSLDGSTPFRTDNTISLSELNALGGPGARTEGDNSTEVVKNDVVLPVPKPKRPSLENAGVKAAAIRQEEEKDRIWGAAEAVDSKGKKKAASEREKYMVYKPPEVIEDGSEIVRQRMNGPAGVEWDQDLIHWHNVAHDLAHSGERGGEGRSRISGVKGINKRPLVTSEDHFLSLSFSNALQPSKVIPYYYRASAMDEADFEKEDITITTLITSNRFKVFERLVERYQGPVSATVHVSDTNPRSELLQELDELYHSSPVMMKWVDIHLVYDPFDRQFNMWRNVAKFFARTDYVMMLDVDFWICTDFRTRILQSPEILSRLRTGLAAFVVPAFEFSKQSDGIDPATFPADKPELLKLVEDDAIGMFHKSWAPGHNSTNYQRYYRSGPGQVYRISAYHHSYEPYVVYRREGTPWCDERFIGYGGNKAACLFELYLSGVSFYVLPDDFLIHQSHAYAEKSRKHERTYNRKLYTDFREETCFRYLNLFLESFQITSVRAKNLANECKKIKGFSPTAARLIAAWSPRDASLTPAPAPAPAPESVEGQ